MDTPLSLHYEWTGATVPPPHHFEYTLDIDGLAGTLNFVPGYPQHKPPVWRETFVCSPEAIQNLSEMMQKCRAFREHWATPRELPVGGAQQSLDITRGVQAFHIPTRLTRADSKAVAPLFEAIRALVPQPIWDEIMARRETYAQEQ